MRLLTVLCVAALVVAFAVPASAETQNIKVSGDIKAAYVYQQDIDYTSNDFNNQNFFIQQIGLNVEADLTDNVSTYVRLLNERDWDGINSGPANFNVLLDEAYITLKEMLYAPLTVKIGRQNIWLGKGFVIGNSGPSTWANGALPGTIQEYSGLTAFDAIRATLDYDPWTIDLIYSKIVENNVGAGDDRDLYVANIGYDFTKYDAEAEAYYIYAHDKTQRTPTGKTNSVSTIGLRGSFVPFDSMNIWAEGAYQFGKARTATLDVNRKAGAVDVGADYTFTDVKWTPTLGAEWIWLSGDKQSSSRREGFDPLFRGKFDNYLADFRGITKVPTQGTATNNTGMTNQQSIALFGSIAPVTDITVDARWTALWHDQKLTASSDENKKLGYELDGKVAYDYTEDVQLSVAGGVLWPGNYYDSPNNKTASQIVAGVSVDF